MFKDLKKPYLIAELSGNHNGSLDRAKELIVSAKKNGADCIKLQTYTPDTMTIKSDQEDFKIEGGLWDGYNLWDLYEMAHTPFEWQKELFEFAKINNITCISTPFDETAVDLLEEIGTPFYKIASFELTDLPLVKYVALKKKPIIISSGMADEKEILESLEVIKTHGNGDLVLLHCVSGYPTPIEEMNLETIELLRNKFDVEVGLSDHTLGNICAIMSVAFGVKVVEKHFTLSRQDGGPDAEFSMEPDELASLSEDLKQAHNALGVGSFDRKEVEKPNIKFRRSIYVVKDVQRGDKFTSENIKRIRPGFGLPPKYYEKLIGKKAKLDLKKGSPLDWSLIED